ncbi:hypothetical protein MCHI_001615 [Candidatus Magnetoovum chiemensis]|nr:hypothetical protein MCHI_001615 [Candidatus Magnetoovum chiemensis]
MQKGYKIINPKKLYATIAADTLGKAVFYPKKLLNRNCEIERQNIKRILIIRCLDFHRRLRRFQLCRQTYYGFSFFYYTKTVRILYNKSPI